MEPTHAPLPEFVRLAAHPLRWELLSALAEGDLRVRELVARTGEPQNLISYHLRLLRDGGLVTTTRSSHDGRDTYYHLDLDRVIVKLTETGAALHPAIGSVAPAALDGTSVLFVCTGNSARSPMAEAVLRHRTGGRVKVTSAGSSPKPDMNANTVRVLRDGFGIDIAGQLPRDLKTLARRRFDHVITLCDRAREACPEFPDHPRRVHWSISEPDDYAAFERTAADIDTRIRHLMPVLAKEAAS